MSKDTPRQVIAQVVDEETFWRGIPRLSDAEFELLRQVWITHRTVLQARIGAGNVFDEAPPEWVYFRCDLHFQVIVTAREKESGTRAWREVVAIWGRDALTSVFWAVASLHPFRALVPPKSLRQASDGFDTVERLLKTAQEKPEELLRRGWYAQGYAPQLSRWLVEVPCLLTDLVRVAERRRELERQQPAPAAAAPPADASPAAPTVPPPPRTANHDRDRKAYELAKRGKTWKEVVVAINKMAKQRGWDGWETEEAAYMAVQRFVARNQLPPLPPRKAGRKRRV